MSFLPGANATTAAPPEAVVALAPGRKLTLHSRPGSTPRAGAAAVLMQCAARADTPCVKDAPFIVQLRALVAERWPTLLICAVLGGAAAIGVHAAGGRIGQPGTLLAAQAAWLPVAVVCAVVLFVAGRTLGHPDLGSAPGLDPRDGELLPGLVRAALIGVLLGLPGIGALSTAKGDIIAAAYLMLVAATAPAGIASIGTGTSQWGAPRLLRIADRLPLVFLQAASLCVVVCLAAWVTATALPNAAGVAVGICMIVCVVAGLALDAAAPPALGDAAGERTPRDQARAAIPASTALPGAGPPPVGTPPGAAVPVGQPTPTQAPAGSTPTTSPESPANAPATDSRTMLAWRLARLGGSRIHEEWVWVGQRGVLCVEFDTGSATGLVCELVDASGRRMALPAPTEGAYTARVEVPTGWFAVVLREEPPDEFDVASARVVELHVLLAPAETQSVAQV